MPTASASRSRARTSSRRSRPSPPPCPRRGSGPPPQGAPRGRRPPRTANRGPAGRAPDDGLRAHPLLQGPSLRRVREHGVPGEGAKVRARPVRPHLEPPVASMVPDRKEEGVDEEVAVGRAVEGERHDEPAPGRQVQTPRPQPERHRRDERVRRRLRIGAGVPSRGFGLLVAKWRCNGTRSGGIMFVVGRVCPRAGGRKGGASWIPVRTHRWRG